MGQMPWKVSCTQPPSPDVGLPSASVALVTCRCRSASVQLLRTCAGARVYIGSCGGTVSDQVHAAHEFAGSLMSQPSGTWKVFSSPRLRALL